MGSLWSNIHQQSIRSIPKFENYIFKDVLETKMFKFSPSTVYTSHKRIIIPVKIGND